MNEKPSPTPLGFHRFVIKEAINDLRRDGLNDDEIAKLLLQTIHEVFKEEQLEASIWVQ